MQDFEKLGLFYLGRSFDPVARKADDALILYDSRDLVTHAVCVGMTGSGKTGLCISLLEEAAIDHVPAIAIDPKGDIANLLLTFPQLRGEDFAPWVDDGEARKAGLAPADFAAKQAELWSKGLADWGQDGARIQRLRDSADFRVYTPGSSAGLPLSILDSFAAPPAAVRDDAEALNDRVGNTADSLLSLLGIAADPMQSREHILVATLLAHAWKAGEDLELGSLIARIQNPPFSRVGVIELESFYPAKDRFALALRLNNLLASPGFETWLKGDPLDIDKLLHAPDGKPRIAIISIAHLGDAERMFFVSLLLNQVLGWVRTQSGTTSLRALLYMDEIFGYFPPVANPPSKKPLLTLLKQARAYGLGIVLATQNPADLDYKGLSNTGTWFLGRLQAERDKLRVLEGLEGAAAAQSARFDRQQIETILSGLAQRTFLLHNVHEDQARVFQVRWALSYLRGPLTRQQIKQLMDPLRTPEPKPGAVADSGPKTAPAPVPASASPEAAPTEPPPSAASTAPALQAPAATTNTKPLLPPDVPQFFLPLRKNAPPGATLVYHPHVLGCASVSYSDAKAKVDATIAAARLATLSHEALTVDWTVAAVVTLAPDDLEKEPAGPAQFRDLPAAANKAKSYATWTRSFVDAVYRSEALVLQTLPKLGAVALPDEPERDFRVRLQQVAKEARDAELDRLTTKYAPKFATIKQKIRKAEEILEREAAQARSSTMSSLARIGETVLGAFLSRKKLSTTNVSKASSAVRNAGKTMKESNDVARARKDLEKLRGQEFELDTQFRNETRAFELLVDPISAPLEELRLKPRKMDVVAKLVVLAWAPHWTSADGTVAPAWD